MVLTDAGYRNEPDLLELDNRGIDAHVARGREGKSEVAVDPAGLPATQRMGEKLASVAGKARHAQCKWLSEASNDWRWSPEDQIVVPRNRVNLPRVAPQ